VMVPSPLGGRSPDPESTAPPAHGMERCQNAGNPGSLHLSVGDLKGEIEDVRRVLHRLETAGDTARSDLVRLGADLQALYGEVTGATGEARLSRQEAQQALAELSETRAGLEGQESRLRALATEGQHLRSHVSNALERASSEADTGRARLATDAIEIRSAVDELANETWELRQSVVGLEQAERHRRAESMGSPGQADLLEAIAASEQRNAERVAEVHETVEKWQRRTLEQRQGIIQNTEDVRNALEADIQELRTKLDQVQSRVPLEEWAKAAASAAEPSVFEADVDRIMEEKLTRTATPLSPNKLAGIDDMPRAWRSALEDAVRRVHWVSDEARRELLRRSEEERANVEARLTRMNAEQARRMAEAQEAADEAIRRADSAINAAQLSAELGKENEEAVGRRIAAVTGSSDEVWRAELKAATGEIATRIEDVAQTHRMRCASLEEACSGLRQDVADVGNQGRHTDELIRSLEVSIREVSENTHSNAKAIDEQKVKFKKAFDPFRDDVDRQLRTVSQEAEQIRLLVNSNTRNLTNEVSAAKANFEARCIELGGNISQLSSRVDCEVMDWAERAGKVEALKRRLGEEATAAVSARWSELGDFAKSLRDTLLAEVRTSLAHKLHSVDDIATRVTDLGASIDVKSDQARKQGEQLQAALAAAERTAVAAREDSSDALRRARRLETLIASLAPGSSAANGSAVTPRLGGDSGSMAGNCAIQAAAEAAAAPESPTAASGSAVGAARLLRGCQ